MQQDDNAESRWSCKASLNPAGSGCSITYTFGQAQDLSSLEIGEGYHSRDGLFASLRKNLGFVGKTWEYARFLSGLFWPLECMAVCGKRYIRLAAPTSPVSSISTDCSLLLLQINPYILYMMCLHSERSPGRQEGQQANIARLLRRCNDHNVLVSLPTNLGRCFCHAPVVSAHFRSRRPPLEG